MIFHYKYLFITSLCLLALSNLGETQDTPKDSKLKLYNGAIAEPSEAKFVVFISLRKRNGRNAIFGGSLIAPNLVLTAASGLYNKRPEDITIRYATHNKKEKIYDDIKVKKIYKNDKFERRAKKYMRYDLAILELEENVYEDGDRVSILDKTQLSRKPVIFAGVPTIAFGWGETINEKGHIVKPTNLRKTEMFVLSRDVCDRKWPERSNGHICVQNPRSGVCPSDIGSPLLAGDTLIAIASSIDKKIENRNGKKKKLSCYPGGYGYYVNIGHQVNREFIDRIYKKRKANYESEWDKPGKPNNPHDQEDYEEDDEDDDNPDDEDDYKPDDEDDYKPDDEDDEYSDSDDYGAGDDLSQAPPQDEDENFNENVNVNENNNEYYNDDY